MTTKVIGYLEGTDSAWLTGLMVQGHDTLPISNGADGHGRDILQLSPLHPVALIIGYLHKLVPAHGQDWTTAGLLHATRVYEIPVLIACPAAAHKAARERLGELPPNAELVDPAEMMARAARILGGS
jgi:hypothetical protein